MFGPRCPRPRVALVALLGPAIMCVALFGAVGPAAAQRAGAASRVAAAPGAGEKARLPGPPSAAQCRRLTGGCVTPAQLRRAYGVDALLANGVNGQGVTIGIVDAFGSPTLAADLAVYDRQYDLPAIDLQVVDPVGRPPPFSTRDRDMLGWAEETTLDVEAAHVIAPAATILLIVTPVSETEGRHGFPQIIGAENAMLDRVDVLSQSFGATEQTFTNPAEIRAFSGQVYPRAQAAGIPVLSASGDSGPTDFTLDSTTLYDKPVTSWPASDPLVTAVGGTMLNLDSDGNPAGEASGWSGDGAGGGGVSTVFGRPTYQAGIAAAAGGQRAVPDIALDAAPASGLILYGSYRGAQWSVGGGTSQATPIMAGIAALATQVAGGRLGSLNRTLYTLADQTDHGAAAGIVDVTRGNNTLNRSKVSGYPARAGYDLATGLGTIDAATLVPALAAAVRGRTEPLASSPRATPSGTSSAPAPSTAPPAAPGGRPGERVAPAGRGLSGSAKASAVTAGVALVLVLLAAITAVTRRRHRSGAR